jgi:(1->4)-alpha-D-glucan 1-alpha-D-glucosylmutase
VQRIALLGALNSLSQITLKATLPGVPDFYQGTEFWDLSLVDPDNRRPVDFAARATVLAAMDVPDWRALAQDWGSGLIKLAWIRHLLKLRNEHADLFAQGDYQELEVNGQHRDHVIAFARRHGRDAVIVAAGRALAPVSAAGRAWPSGEAWQGSLVAKGYAIEGTDGVADTSELPLADLFQHLPVVVRKAHVKATATSRRAQKRSG